MAREGWHWHHSCKQLKHNTQSVLEQDYFEYYVLVVVPGEFKVLMVILAEMKAGRIFIIRIPIPRN